jgi:hypothetical protein
MSEQAQLAGYAGCVGPGVVLGGRPGCGAEVAVLLDLLPAHHAWRGSGF